MPRTRELILLGLVQGPAEMLPISSSAHLALLHPPARSGAERKELEVALHLGSALALLASRPRIRPAFLAAATAPAALAGYLLQRPIEERLGTPATIAAGLLAGSAALLVADRTPEERSEPGWRDGLALGLAQACALFPGVSRAGATWTAARRRGFTRAAATELSREVALPVLLGAAALKVRRARNAPGVAAAAVSTAAAMRAPVDRLPAWAWAGYRAALAGVILAVRHNRTR
jgi:undecaprenyl-diphosphatase